MDVMVLAVAMHTRMEGSSYHHKENIKGCNILLFLSSV